MQSKQILLLEYLRFIIKMCNFYQLVHYSILFSQNFFLISWETISLVCVEFESTNMFKYLSRCLECKIFSFSQNITFYGTVDDCNSFLIVWKYDSLINFILFVVLVTICKIVFTYFCTILQQNFSCQCKLWIHWKTNIRSCFTLF